MKVQVILLKNQFQWFIVARIKGDKWQPLKNGTCFELAHLCERHKGKLFVRDWEVQARIPFDHIVDFM